MKANKRKEIYQTSKLAKVGDICICAACGTKFKKASYQQTFCKSNVGTKCKDKYWNTVTPSKRNNTTRKSPANRRYYNDVILPREAEERGFPDVETMLNHVDDYDGSWDAHYAHTEPCDFCGLRHEYCQCGDGEHL